MSTAMQWLLVAGNVITLAAGFLGLVRWFRTWLVREVSKPLTLLTDELSHMKTRLDMVDQSTKSAHSRLDNVLLGRNIDA